MKKALSTDDWTIYNCHIHTFTKQHTPSHFIKFVLADSDLGRINWRRIPLYLFVVLLYLGILALIADFTVNLSTNLNVLTMPVYALALLLNVVLVFPLILLAAILVALAVILVLQGMIDWLIKARSQERSPQSRQQLMRWRTALNRGQRRVMRSDLLINLLIRINPASNDIFERTARFLKMSSQPSQQAVFDQIEVQYPKGKTVFIALPMDMTFMKLGKLEESIDAQHAELLELARCSNGQIIPFYAADPRHEDLVERVRKSLASGKFHGIKIYPGLGYKPNHERLMDVYKLCIAGNFPVVTHCSPGGVWQYGLTAQERRANSNPLNYRDILDQPEYRNLKLCLAHFGGAEEWMKHLKGRARAAENQEDAWVKTIYEMIACGRYPNLYTDISYTVFTPKVKELYIDLIDYLKVMLSNPLVRRRVLFGSDYYMVERENISEKEASILLRSRLGEDLYKQIAYTNPREYLGIESDEALLQS